MKGGRDFLGGFGPDHHSPQKPGATSGGVMQAKDLNYCPPQGPIGINNPQRPGLHGHEHGNRQQFPTNGGRSGSPGIGGVSHGKTGSQK